jgi:hypothetical protein
VAKYVCAAWKMRTVYAHTIQVVASGQIMLPPGLTSPSTLVGGKALNPIGAVEVLGGFVLTAGPPCLGIC